MLSGGRGAEAVCGSGRGLHALRAGVVPTIVDLALPPGTTTGEEGAKRGGSASSSAASATGEPPERRPVRTSSAADRLEERALLGWAIHLTDYARDAPLPAARYVSPDFFEEHACAGRSDCRVLGRDDDGHVVYVVESLRSLDSLFARSLLVHEFVHYPQHISGRFATHGCEYFVEREREAYAVQ